jgi:hypothetical protein
MSIQKPTSNPNAQRATETANSSATMKAITMQDTLLGTDPPLEKAHPGLQPVLVFASYPIALIVLISIVALYFAFFRSKASTMDARPGQSEIAK